MRQAAKRCRVGRAGPKAARPRRKAGSRPRSDSAGRACVRGDSKLRHARALKRGFAAVAVMTVGATVLGGLPTHPNPALSDAERALCLAPLELSIGYLCVRDAESAAVPARLGPVPDGVLPAVAVLPDYARVPGADGGVSGTDPRMRRRDSGRRLGACRLNLEISSRRAALPGGRGVTHHEY